ncbi:MAG TPA: alpha/beta fold hydrolase [Blastocatellia bacterium]
MELRGNLFIEGPTGRLEAILKDPSTLTGRSAVICHPHPLYGGTMHNKVVYRIARTFNEAGFTALRFNFRGVGLSAGVHDYGHGEQQDLLAVIDFIQRRYPHDEIWAAGFSFGSTVMLRVCCGDSRIRALVAAGVPTSVFEPGQVSACDKPKLVVNGSQDEFGPTKGLRRFFDQLSGPKELAIIEGADHFFEGHLDELSSSVAAFINQYSNPKGV